MAAPARGTTDLCTHRRVGNPAAENCPLAHQTVSTGAFAAPFRPHALLAARPHAVPRLLPSLPPRHPAVGDRAKTLPPFNRKNDGGS